MIHVVTEDEEWCNTMMHHFVCRETKKQCDEGFELDGHHTIYVLISLHTFEAEFRT